MYGRVEISGTLFIAKNRMAQFSNQEKLKIQNNITRRATKSIHRNLQFVIK